MRFLTQGMGNESRHRKTNINARHTWSTCVMDLDCRGITTEAKECACMISNVVISDPLGLIARLASESSCVHCFRRQDVLQMRNEFTFHCTKNPAAHLSSIRTHLLLLFLSFPPSWDSSWSTSWWKAPSLLFHFHPFFSLKRQEDSLSSLKAFWLEL